MKDEVHQIKTRAANSWDMHLKRVFMNGKEIYSEHATDAERKVLFEPTFSHIHIPIEDFETLQEIIINHNDNNEQL